MSHFQIVGHRGAPRQAPENTLLSFTRAIEIGVDWIELDVRRSKDGILVVIHDDTVDRTTNGHGRVAVMTFDELEMLDAGDGEKIPSLEQSIRLAKDKVKMDMEIKDTDIEADVVDAIRRNGIIDRCMVSSFMQDAIARVKKLDPGIMTAAILDKMPDNVEGYLNTLRIDVRADAIMISKKIATPPFIAEIRRQGFKAGIWNADAPEDIEKYAAIDPDYLCSNYPDRLVGFRLLTVSH